MLKSRLKMQLLRHSREGGNPERCAGTTDLSRANLDSRLRGNDRGRAGLFALLPALLPLPLGEVTSEGCLLLPLPLGEGRGEGSANRNPAFRFAIQPTTASPHPSPLPEGEGTEKPTIKVGAAYATSVWSRARFNTLEMQKNFQKPFNTEQSGERGGRGVDTSLFGNKIKKTSASSAFNSSPPR